MLTNDIVSFEQPDPGLYDQCQSVLSVGLYIPDGQTCFERKRVCF